MRRSEDIADLRAMAASLRTPRVDTDRVIENFTALRSDKAEASVMLGYYAKHPTVEGTAGAIVDAFFAARGKSR